MENCVWKRAADNIFKTLTEESTADFSHTLSENLANISGGDVTNEIREKKGSDILGCYLPMSSPGTIVIYADKCKTYVLELLAQKTFVVDSKEDLEALINAITLSTYIHESFHHFVDIVNQLYQPKNCIPIEIEEALATAFEYRFFYGDAFYYTFSKYYYIVCNYFSSYGVQENELNIASVKPFNNGYWPKEKKTRELFGDVLFEMPYYSVDNRDNNGGDFEWFARFSLKFKKKYLDCYQNISAAGYRDWGKFMCHNQFLKGLEEYLQPQNTILINSGVRLDYMLYHILQSSFLSKKCEIIK